MATFKPPELHQFSMWQLQLNRHIVMINGKRNSGKSTLIADILYHHRHIRKVVVFSGSESANGFYTKLCVPKMFIRHGFDPVYLEKMYNEQKTTQSSCLLILDDLSFDDTIWKDKTIIDIMNMGRHQGLGVVFASQYVMHVPLKLRGQIDFFFALKDNSHQNQERLHKCFFSFIKKTNDFCDVYKHFTDNFGVLVSDCTANEHAVQKCMYWYKALVHPFRFHVGCRAYRQLYGPEQQLDPDYHSDYEENDETVRYSKDGTKKKKKRSQTKNNISSTTTGLLDEL